MIKYGIEATGWLKRPIAELDRLLRGNVKAALNKEGETSRDIVRRPIPKGKSGVWQAVKLKRATLARLEIFLTSSHPLAGVVEEKTKAHVIRPRRASVLAFSVGGRRVFAAQVRHPGTRGKRSWRAARARAKTAIPAAIKRAVDAALAGRTYNG